MKELGKGDESMVKKNYDIDSDAPIGAEYAETAQPPEQPSAKANRLIYVGPNVPGGILQRFQVFKGGLPPYCKDLFEKAPKMKELFVPVEFLVSIHAPIKGTTITKGV
jgi:hypothetical protein